MERLAWADRKIADLAELRALAAELAPHLPLGSIILLTGPLGVGKTAFVKCFAEVLGFRGVVRSPTFNLMQEIETSPPMLHADLYRLAGARGIGIEDYFDTHVCFIEWPDRLGDLVDPKSCWQVAFEFAELESRQVTVLAPIGLL